MLEMAACYPVMTIYATPDCREQLGASNDRKHSSLHCAPSSSPFSLSEFLTSKSPFLRSRVLCMGGQTRTDTIMSPSPPPVPKKRLRRSKTSTNDNEKTLFEGTEDFEFEHGYTMKTVCDRLIEILTQEKTAGNEWRKLLLMSDEWDRVKPYFFKRCRYKASLETDKVKQEGLLSLCTKIEKVDADMEKQKQLLDFVQANWPELDVVVAGRRNEFSNVFFQYLTLLCEVSTRLNDRDDLARIAAKCLAAVEAHDRALEDEIAVTVAQQRFDKVLDSASLEEACSKIDKLGEKKLLDSTLMVLFTKAWAAAKDSNTMTDEIKDLMHHLYMVARANIHRWIPKEIRILQKILSVEEPTLRFKALTECFSPGDEYTEKARDMLYTNPERLLKWINIVLDGYHFNKQETVMEAARQLMTPQIIDRLLQLRVVVEDQFLSERK